MQSAVLFLVTSGVSAYLWSCRVGVPRSRPIRLLYALVLWVGLQVIVVQFAAALQIAGIIRRFDLGILAWVQCAILAATYACHMVAPSKAVSADYDLKRVSKLPFYLLLGAAIIICCYAVFAGNLLTSYPSGADALGYHLPLSVRWLQEGSLRIPVLRNWVYSFPGNAEIGMMLLLGTGHQALVPLVNWLAVAVLMIAVYLVAVRLSNNDTLAALTTTLVVSSIPMVQFQAFSGYVDLFGAGFLMAALALFLNRYVASSSAIEPPVTEKLSLSTLFISAVACGISVGTKPLFYLYGAMYLLLVTLILGHERRRHNRPVLPLIGLIVLGTLLPSAFWFGRAMYATGNPIYPLQVKVGKTVVLPGITAKEITPVRYTAVRRASEWLIYPWTEWKNKPGYLLIPYSTGDGLGAAFATFIPLALAFNIYERIRLRGSPYSQTILLLSWLTLFLAWWFVMNRELRYGLTIWVLACLFFAPIGVMLQAANSRVFKALLVCSLFTTCAISGFVPFHDLVSRIRANEWSRSEFYSYPRMIDELPVGSCVLNNTGVHEYNFVLAGSRLTNCVVPTFEAPSSLTPQFLQKYKIDFVVERIPENESQIPLQDVGDASLVGSEVITSGENKALWRIWKVREPGSSGLTELRQRK